MYNIMHQIIRFYIAINLLLMSLNTIKENLVEYNNTAKINSISTILFAGIFAIVSILICVWPYMWSRTLLPFCATLSPLLIGINVIIQVICEYTKDGNLDIGKIIVGLILSALGILFTYMLISFKKDKRKEDLFKKNSYIVNAKLVSVETDTSQISNGESPCYIICEGINPKDGMTYTYKSEAIWEFSEEIIKKTMFENLEVYVDENDFNKYVVDIDDVLYKAIQIVEEDWDEE